MAEKHFTYKVSVSFQTQITFSESEVEQGDDGGDGDLSPTGAALEAIRNEIEECLNEHLVGFVGGEKIEIWAGFDDLLGVVEEE